MNEQDLVLMGYVQGAFGVRGWISVHPDTTSLEGLLAFSTWYIGKKGSKWASYSLLEAKQHGLCLIARLESILNREDALSLKGFCVAVPRSQLPPTPCNEYYWADLMDASVSNEAGELFGSIKRILRTPAHDILVVQEGQKEHLIPFISVFIKEVKLSQKHVVVAWQKDY